MKLKIIIPIINPKKHFFEKVIPSLNKQTVRNDIVLINSGSKLDSTDYYEVINIDIKDFNHANTRNLALLYDSDFYLFITQDAEAVDEIVIEKLLEPFQNQDVVVSYARQIPYDNAHITEKFARNRNYPEKSVIKSKDDIKNLGIKTFFSSDSCAMYRGDYFKKVGGFKRDLNVSEDMEFAARAIFDERKVAYCAEARVFHSHVYNTIGLYRRYVAIGRFFKENEWIQNSLNDVASTEKTGKQQVLEEFKYILSRQPSALVKSFLFNIVKYVGYKTGKYFN